MSVVAANFCLPSTRSWELLDDPSRSAVCSCCDRVCKHRARRDVDSGTTILFIYFCSHGLTFSLLTIFLKNVVVCLKNLKGLFRMQYWGH